MKTLFGILLLLFIAASAALLVAKNPGYVLIAREPWVLETSLAVFALILTALFAAAYFLARLLARIIRAPRDLARWRQARRTRRAREAFFDGVNQLLSGDWLKSEKSLLASLHAADAPHLGYLAAALAAHGQNDSDKRDDYLARAAEQQPEGSQAADLTRARLQLLDNHTEQALATLAQVRARQPDQIEAMRLTLEACRKLRDWPGLTRLLPEARRRKLLAPAALDALELETHRELLGLDLPPGELATLQRAWDEVPARLRQHPSLIATYARQLQRQGAAEDCARLLATALEHGWDETLARLYGDTVTAQPAAQLESAEEWVARHGESAGLLLTLGKLAHRQRLLDRARGYLERSLALEASPAAHEELARVFEADGDAAQALHHYRRALDLCQAAPLAQRQAAAAAAATRLSDYGY